MANLSMDAGWAASLCVSLPMGLLGAVRCSSREYLTVISSGATVITCMLHYSTQFYLFIHFQVATRATPGAQAEPQASSIMQP